MEIKEIHLMFENCEVVKLQFNPYENNFSASNIVDSIFSGNGNEVFKFRTAKSMQIIIPNKQLYVCSNWGTPLIDKLEDNDITFVFLKYEDDTEDEIRALWDEDEMGPDEVNDYQHNEFKDNCVVININDKWNKR